MCERRRFHVFREFKYMLLSSLRSRELIFWTLLFPFALTTFMYMAFGDIFDRTEKFEPVPVAIVKEQDNMTLTAMLNAVSAEGDKKLLITTYTGEKEAKKLLEEDQVKGIIYMGKQAFSHGERKAWMRTMTVKAF